MYMIMNINYSLYRIDLHNCGDWLSKPEVLRAGIQKEITSRQESHELQLKLEVHRKGKSGGR